MAVVVYLLHDRTCVYAQFYILQLREEIGVDVHLAEFIKFKLRVTDIIEIRHHSLFVCSKTKNIPSTLQAPKLKLTPKTCTKSRQNNANKKRRPIRQLVFAHQRIEVLFFQNTALLPFENFLLQNCYIWRRLLKNQRKARLKILLLFSGSFGTS